MAGFLSKLFGFGGSSAGAGKPAEGATEAYGELVIRSTPIREGSQFRVAGSIEKQTDAGLLTREFIRADLFSSAEDANAAALRKGRQIVDQSGTSLFADGAPTGRV